MSASSTSGVAPPVEFINSNENAKVGAFIFSGNYSSSEQGSPDDENYDPSGLRDLA
jgi:hypothetical protein